MKSVKLLKDNTGLYKLYIDNSLVGSKLTYSEAIKLIEIYQGVNHE